jgi:rubrerythrin
MTLNQPDFKPHTCDMNLEDALFDLNQALVAEERSLDSYQFLADLLTDQDDQDLLRDIASDEERHITMVKSLIETLKQNYQEPARS